MFEGMTRRTSSGMLFRAIVRLSIGEVDSLADRTLLYGKVTTTESGDD